MKGPVGSFIEMVIALVLLDHVDLEKEFEREICIPQISKSLLAVTLISTIAKHTIYYKTKE
jgi:hypothetical protein